MMINELKSLLTSLLVLSAIVDSWGQNHQGRLDLVDIQQYSFELNLYDTTDRIEARASIILTFKKPVDTLHLDFVARQSSGLGMKVHKVMLDDELQLFIHRNDSLLITRDGGSYSGKVVFDIYYSGIPADGLLIARNLYGDQTTFADNWPNRARNWLPTIDHPSDKALVEFKVLAPPQYQVIANGEKQWERDSASKLMTHWKTEVPIPTKVMVIGVANFDIKKLGASDKQKIPVSNWVYPQEAEEAHQSFASTLDILDYLVDKIGPYPYAKLVNVQSKTRYGGMENAGNIFYSEQAVQSSRDIELLITHEIAHQWFGNSVTEENWHHVWLSEGFATYMTNLYIEDQYGQEPFQQHLSDQRERVIEFYKIDPKPVIDQHETNYDSLLNANTYQKGSWFLHMLRKEIGDSIFQKSLKQYYRKFRNANANTEDFRKLVEVLSGKDLEEFFSQWLYQPGHPLLEINWMQSEDSITFTVNQRQEQLFHFPLEIKTTTHLSKSQSHTVRIESRSQNISFKTAGRIKRVEVDPDVWLLYEPYRE